MSEVIHTIYAHAAPDTNWTAAVVQGQRRFGRLLITTTDVYGKSGDNLTAVRVTSIQHHGQISQRSELLPEHGLPGDIRQFTNAKGETAAIVRARHPLE